MTDDQLRSLLGDLSAVQLVLWIIAAIAAVVFIVKMWPFLSRFVATINALADLPAKLALLDEVHHEVRPNTGTSLNDAVRRVEAVQHQQSIQLNEQDEKLAGLQELMESGDADLGARVGDLEDTMNPKKE